MTLKKPPDPSASRLPSPQRQETDKRGGTALACAQHPAPFLPSLAESRYSLFTTPVQLFRAPSAPVRARPTAPRGSSTFSHCTYQAEKPAAEKGGNRVKRRGNAAGRAELTCVPPPGFHRLSGDDAAAAAPSPGNARGALRAGGGGGGTLPPRDGDFQMSPGSLRAPPPPPEAKFLN